MAASFRRATNPFPAGGQVFRQIMQIQLGRHCLGVEFFNIRLQGFNCIHIILVLNV